MPRDPFRDPTATPDPPVQYPDPAAIAWRRRLEAITTIRALNAGRHLAVAPTRADMWKVLQEAGTRILDESTDPDLQSLGRRLHAIGRDGVRTITAQTGGPA